jgi:uncharacterized protein (DUF302 family)
VSGTWGAYCTSLILDGAFDVVLEDVRAGLSSKGFGILTEIDVRATFKAKLGIDVPAQVILGACNPPLAQRALTVEPSLGTLLPCNVVVREDAGRTIVEAIDPFILVSATGNEDLIPIAREVSEKLKAALEGLALEGQ